MLLFSDRLGLTVSYCRTWAPCRWRAIRGATARSLTSLRNQHSQRELLKRGGDAHNRGMRDNNAKEMGYTSKGADRAFRDRS
jgi:hypothetical protein